MANTRLFLDMRRIKGDKPGLLKIAIAHRHTSALVSLDIKLLPGKEWDSQKEKVINHPERTMLNAYISKIKGQIDSLILQLTNECKIGSMTASDIKQCCEDILNPESKKQKEDET